MADFAQKCAQKPCSLCETAWLQGFYFTFSDARYPFPAGQSMPRNIRIERECCQAGVHNHHIVTLFSVIERVLTILTQILGINVHKCAQKRRSI